METKIITKKNGKKETYFRATCSACNKDRGFVRKSRIEQLCQTCGGRKSGLKNRGKIGPNKGRIFSSDTCRKMAEAKRGSIPWNKGKKEKRSAVLNKISEAKRGSKPWNVGVPMQETQRIKLSCSLQGIEIRNFTCFKTTSERKLRNAFNEQQLHIQCFERDNWTCLKCGKRGGKLNAHHLNSWKHFPEQRFMLENLVTTCRICHELFHKKFGNGKKQPNTKDQFELFLKESHPNPKQ